MDEEMRTWRLLIHWIGSLLALLIVAVTIYSIADRLTPGIAIPSGTQTVVRPGR